MSNRPAVPVAIRSLSFLLPLLALIQLALAALLTFNAMMNSGRAGNPAPYIGAVLGLALIACAIVAIVAIFTLRRRSRTMRIAVTTSCLITIGVAIMALVEVLIAYSAGVAGGISGLSWIYVYLPLLVVFAMPAAVLIVLWAAPSTRAFFKASPPQG